MLILAGDSLFPQSLLEEEGGTWVGVVANRRKEGDRLEFWVSGREKGSSPSEAWLVRFKMALGEKLGVTNQVSTVLARFRFRERGVTEQHKLRASSRKNSFNPSSTRNI